MRFFSQNKYEFCKCIVLTTSYRVNRSCTIFHSRANLPLKHTFHIYDVILGLILISRVKLCPVAEENVNTTQIFSATSVGVLLQSNGESKLNIMLEKKQFIFNDHHNIVSMITQINKSMKNTYKMSFYVTTVYKPKHLVRHI